MEVKEDHQREGTCRIGRCVIFIFIHLLSKRMAHARILCFGVLFGVSHGSMHEVLDIPSLSGAGRTAEEALLGDGHGVEMEYKSHSLNPIGNYYTSLK